MNGIEGDGDVTKRANLEEFAKFVLEQTNQRGVHFLMADGVNFKINISNFNHNFRILTFNYKGFSVEGNENIQEILSKQFCLQDL